MLLLRLLFDFLKLSVLTMYAYKNLSIHYPKSRLCLNRYVAVGEKDERRI